MSSWDEILDYGIPQVLFTLVACPTGCVYCSLSDPFFDVVSLWSCRAHTTALLMLLADMGLSMAFARQMADPNVLKQYIFQKGYVTEATKQRRQLEAANSTLQVQPMCLLFLRQPNS